MPGAVIEKTERSRLRRMHERGHYDRETVHAILDATPMCHLGYVLDGRPAVVPTFHWREGERVYWHGSSASRALRASEGRDVCLTVSLLDGLVLARSGFHHSANYRSVMLFGRATKLVDPEEKLAKLRRFVEGLYPGRWDALRPVREQELLATTILWLPIEEASAKIRSGPPADDASDLSARVWAGVLPIRHELGAPIPDAHTPEDVEAPGYTRRQTLS